MPIPTATVRRPLARSTCSPARPTARRTSSAIPRPINDGQGGLTLIGDTDPGYDMCSSTTSQVDDDRQEHRRSAQRCQSHLGLVRGRLQSADHQHERHHRLQAQHQQPVVGGNVTDYVPHHIWFQYFASTANPTHARPNSTEAIGYTRAERQGRPANHAYDLKDFYEAVKAGNYPAVSYIKMAAYQDGHAGNSDPLDEQAGTRN